MKCLGWHCRQNKKQLASGSECWGSFKILTSYLCVPNMSSLNSVLLCGRGLAANLPVFSLRQTTKTALFPPWFARATSPEDLPEPWAEMPNTPNLNAASDTCEQASKATSNFAVLGGLQVREPRGTLWLFLRRSGLLSKCEWRTEETLKKTDVWGCNWACLCPVQTVPGKTHLV